MFLTKVTFEQGPKLFNLLRQKSGNDGYIAHQILWELFPDVKERAKKADGNNKLEFLFYKDAKSIIPQYYLVSQKKPEESEAFFIQSKEYSPQLSTGQQLAFTLVANPVVSRKTEGKKHSVKHDVWMDAKKAKKKELENSEGVFEKTSINLQEVQQYCEKSSKEWLIKQGLRCGFSLKSENILVDGYLQNYIHKKGGKEPIRYSSIHYEGLLTVTDPILFIKMLGEGIGKSKAFGCGLMLVRKI